MTVMRNHLTCLLLVLLVTTPGLAEEATQPAPATLYARLGTPARVEAVHAVLEEHGAAEASALVRVARALGMARGPAAVEGLIELTRHDDARVRAAAFRAVTLVGLRHAKLRDRARWAMGRRSEEEQQAAVRALGALGDARDVPDLLHIAGDEAAHPALRLAAFDALRHLGGESKPYRIDRWRTWWDAVGKRGPAEVVAAMRTFDEQPALRAVAAGILARKGWLRLGPVSRKVEAWLRDEDPEVRSAAARIAQQLRSAELAGPLTEAWESAPTDSPLRRGVAAALQALGAEVPAPVAAPAAAPVAADR